MIVLMNSIVMAGAGKAIVCAVGESTLNEKELVKKDLLIEEKTTKLQAKLAVLATQIKKIAFLSAAIIFVVLMVYWMIKLMVNGQPMVGGKSLTALIENLEVFIAILIVCVPEGLPLAVSVAMAFSTERIQEANLLVKNIESLE
jgi:magnesium-transporting ATPase (P-type)